MLERVPCSKSMKNALQRISDAISRKQDVAAVVVPRCLALAILDDLYPQAGHREADGMDADVEKARNRYLRLVTEGGYVGMIMSVPMIVADDVVVCSLTEQELVESARRLGVDMAELARDRARGF